MSNSVYGFLFHEIFQKIKEIWDAVFETKTDIRRTKIIHPIFCKSIVICEQSKADPDNCLIQNWLKNINSHIKIIEDVGLDCSK